MLLLQAVQSLKKVPNIQFPVRPFWLDGIDFLTNALVNFVQRMN